MSRTFCTLFNAAVLAAAAFQLQAQTPTEPYKVLRIFREDVKEGKGTAHAKSEATFAQALTRLKYPNYGLALSSVTGMHQAWFLEGHDSFDSVAKADAFSDKEPAKSEMDKLDALDSEYRSSSR